GNRRGLCSLFSFLSEIARGPGTPQRRILDPQTERRFSQRRIRFESPARARKANRADRGPWLRSCFQGPRPSSREPSESLENEAQMRNAGRPPEAATFPTRRAQNSCLIALHKRMSL